MEFSKIFDTVKKLISSKNLTEEDFHVLVHFSWFVRRFLASHRNLAVKLNLVNRYTITDEMFIDYLSIVVPKEFCGKNEYFKNLFPRSVEKKKVQQKYIELLKKGKDPKDYLLFEELISQERRKRRK